MRPLKNDPAGKNAQREYVIAVNNQYVLLGPSLDAIQACFQEGSQQIDQSHAYQEFIKFANRRLGDEMCLLSYGRFDRWSERKLSELRKGKLNGLMGTFFQVVGWSDVLPQVKAYVPKFSELEKLCSGHLGIAGRSTQDGWKLIVRLKTGTQK